MLLQAFMLIFDQVLLDIWQYYCWFSVW